jgi:hypothetical protein
MELAGLLGGQLARKEAGSAQIQHTDKKGSDEGDAK